MKAKNKEKKKTKINKWNKALANNTMSVRKEKKDRN